MGAHAAICEPSPLVAACGTRGVQGVRVGAVASLALGGGRAESGACGEDVRGVRVCEYVRACVRGRAWVSEGGRGRARAGEG